jgi:hypothetical protein
MSYITVDVDVDIDDVISSLSNSERQELADNLYDDGYIPKQVEKESYEHEDEFSLACQKLKYQSWRLSREEEEFIINLSKRF